MPRTSVHTYRLADSVEAESDIEYANSTPDAVILDTLTRKETDNA